MVDSKSNKNYEVHFPEAVDFIIDDILEKYEFEKTEEEMLEKMDQIEDFEEKVRIFESIPGRQIVRTIKEVAQGKIKDKDIFIATLQERLNISKKIAEELVKELEEKVLSLVQITLEEKRKIPLAKEVISPEEPTLPKKPDVYREPIE